MYVPINWESSSVDLQVRHTTSSLTLRTLNPVIFSLFFATANTDTMSQVWELTACACTGAHVQEHTQYTRTGAHTVHTYRSTHSTHVQEHTQEHMYRSTHSNTRTGAHTQYTRTGAHTVHTHNTFEHV